MGRSLHKKYFGNRNIGTTGTADNGIGGEGVASAAVTVAGSYTTLRPSFTFTAPTLPNGVTATSTITSEALSAAVTTAGSGYVVGDLLTLTSAGGSAIAYVASVSTGAVATVNFTGTGASRGSFEALPGAKFPATLTGGRLCAGGTGTGAELTVTFRAASVTITEKGSGYTAAPTVSAYTDQGGVTVATIVVTTDSGNVGSSTNQENAITMVAFLTGGSAGPVDIIKQVSTSRYKVTDGTRTGVVTLKSSVATAAGECSIAATDASAGTYYVTKLTAHRATIYAGTGSIFTSGTVELSVPWTFGTATATVCKIPNA